MSELTWRTERLLSAASGLDLSGYRREHVLERVRRALEREQLPGTAELAVLLAADGDARARFRRSVASRFPGCSATRTVRAARARAPSRARRGRRSSACGRRDARRLGALQRRDPARAARRARAHLPARKRPARRESRRRPAGRLRGVTVPAGLRARAASSGVTSPGRAPPGLLELRPVPERRHLLLARRRAKAARRLVAALAPGGVLLLGRSERLADRRARRRARGPHAYRKAGRDGRAARPDARRERGARGARRRRVRRPDPRPPRAGRRRSGAALAGGDRRRRTLEKLVLDLETGQRGYLITGRRVPRALRPRSARPAPDESTGSSARRTTPARRKGREVIGESIRSYVDDRRCRSSSCES